MVEVLVIIQFIVLVVRSGYTRVTCKKWSFICRDCVNPVTSTGCTSVDIGVSGNVELVDELVEKFCYLRDMLNVDGINSGSWYYCLPIRI